MSFIEDLKQKDLARDIKGLNRAQEEAETAKRAVAMGMQYINLSGYPVDLNVLALFTKQQALDCRSVIFFKDGSDLRIGTLDPHNLLLQEHIKNFRDVHKFRVTLYLISLSSYTRIIEDYNKTTKHIQLAKDVVEVYTNHDYSGEIRALAQPTGVLTASEILTIIMGAAVQYQASDVHIEPEENFIKVRFRLDGVLNDVSHLPAQYKDPLISRIKILSKLKLNVTAVPQDGRFTFYVKAHQDAQPVATDVRVALLPATYGESIALRILNNSEISMKFEDLGLTGRAYDIIREQINMPNGSILTTGPTGSGKTTTLYAFLKELNKPGVKIITLEEPVEYKLEGINQTSITPASGLTFAAGLRAVLRQDPDVVMIGEIRDQETAETALQAALTGHVVLSTLHTNDAAGAIPRLINMGVKPFVIAPAINAILAQRLVRRLCEKCKQETKLEPMLLERVKNILDAIPANAHVKVPELKFFHAPGCNFCNNTGYKGRIGIFEIIPKGPELEKLILSSAPTSDIKKWAIQNGMLTMMQDGLLKALAGITNVEEVFRVTLE